jgi:translocation and assembly module TamA
VLAAALPACSPQPAPSATTPAAAEPDGTTPGRAEAAEDAGNLPYTVVFVPSGDQSLDDALAAASQLAALRETAPTTGFGLVARATADRDRLARVLHADGYWGGAVAITIDGVALGDAVLAERLAPPPAAAPPAPVVVRIEVDRRQQYTVSAVAIRADRPAGDAAVAEAIAQPFGLEVGDPARAASVLAAERVLLDRLLDAGHPLATVVRRETLVDYDRAVMTVGWTLAPGPRAAFAAPTIIGTDRVDQGFLAGFAGHRLTGESYSPARLERVRKEVMALGPFESVRADIGSGLTPTGLLPVTLTVVERPRRALGGSVAYETNFGPSVRLFWEHRNLFGGAERLRLDGEVARIGTGGSLDNATYRAFATLRDPSLLQRDLTLVSTAGALRERLEAYDRDAVVASVVVEQWRSERLTAFAGPTVDIGQAGPPGGSLTPYRIAGVTLGARFDGTDTLLDPARGWRAIGTLNPSYSFRDEQPFAPLRVTASTYWDVLGNRRSILAARATVGSLLGANSASIPQHLRFYAGGGGSVRGYDYQSIGPRDPTTGKPVGGGSLLEAGLEWRQRVWGSFGGVAFVDAGTVATGSAPDLSELRVGVGLGVRYYTPIGPIRADVALPLVRQVGSSGYGIYVGIGQAF